MRRPNQEYVQPALQEPAHVSALLYGSSELVRDRHVARLWTVTLSKASGLYTGQTKARCLPARPPDRQFGLIVIVLDRDIIGTQAPERPNEDTPTQKTLPY